jgi:hypothetical protein
MPRAGFEPATPATKRAQTYALYRAANQSVTLHFCIYGPFMILSVNSDYFLKQRQPVDLCNGEVWCSL